MSEKQTKRKTSRYDLSRQLGEQEHEVFARVIADASRVLGIVRPYISCPDLASKTGMAGMQLGAIKRSGVDFDYDNLINELKRYEKEGIGGEYISQIRADVEAGVMALERVVMEQAA